MQPPLGKVPNDEPRHRSSLRPRAAAQMDCFVAALRNAGAVASIARNRGVGSTALSTPHFLLLYSAMLVASSGNTALQSVMPAIGREIGIADFWVAIAYTWSAVLWVLLANYWAEKSDHHGRKTLAIMGVSGFIVSMLLCGIVLYAGLNGWIGGALTFALFAIFRGIYGGFGCATPSATQAYLASKTRRGGRVAALSALSSSFGLGTIIGPAVAPLFVLPLLGLAGPLFAFAAIAFAVVVRSSVAPQRPRRAQGRARRGDELSLARDAADRRQRRRRHPAAPPAAAQMERPANPPVDRRGRGCGPCPGGDPDVPRLLRHRPAASDAVGFGRTGVDRDDGRGGGDARRAMGADPAARSRAAPADPVGRAGRRRRPPRHDAVLRPLRDHDRLRGRLDGLRLHPSGVHRRGFARRPARGARRRRGSHHRRQRHQLCARAGAGNQPLRPWP